MFKKNNLFYGILIILTLLIWSSAFTAIRIALASFTPANLAVLRFLVASFVLLIYSLIRKISPPELKDLPNILFCGFLGVTVYQLALNYGETLISAGSAGLLVNSYPVFAAILSAIFLGEKICITKWSGIIISFLGIIAITFSSGATVSLSFGALLVLGASLSAGFHTIMQKRLLEKYTPLEISCYLIWSGTFFLIFFSESLINDMTAASGSAIFSVIYLGIFPGALAYLIWNLMLYRYPVTNLSNLQNFIAVFGLVIAYIFLKEIPTLFMITGGLVTISGIFIVNFSSQIRERSLVLLKNAPKLLNVKYYFRKNL
jgi:drug/metabolite transporter (DMT)-like permease